MNFSLFQVDEGSAAKPAKPSKGGSSGTAGLRGEGISDSYDSQAGSFGDKGLSLVDVKNEYSWTLNDKSSRTDVPAIFLIEYQITGGQIQNAVNYWQKNLSLQTGEGIANAITEQGHGETADTNPYQGLYKAAPTGFSYLLPYFSSFRRELGGEWSGDSAIGDAASTIQQMVTQAKWVGKGMAAAAVGAAGAYKIAKSLVPHMGAEKAKIWQSMNEQSVTVQFDLLNTVSVEQTIKNYEFISLISYQNTYFRHNIMLSYPPVMYEYLIPGVRACPAATMNVSIEDLGNKRKINSSNGVMNQKIFPEAYRVTLTLKDLVAESRNVLKGFFDEDVVSAVDKTNDQTSMANAFRDLAETTKKGFAAAGNALSGPPTAAGLSPR